MIVVGFLLALGLASVVGRFLVRRLGYPTDAANALTWGAVILICGLTFASLRDCHGEGLLQGVDGPGTGDIALLVLVVVLALIGYSWLEARATGREGDRRAMRVRRRALPPAPNLPQAQDGDPPAA
ncbi:MAG: hypothetical protein WCG85_04610 [Polyangia bacterium]